MSPLLEFNCRPQYSVEEAVAAAKTIGDDATRQGRHQINRKFRPVTAADLVISFHHGHYLSRQTDKVEKYNTPPTFLIRGMEWNAHQVTQQSGPAALESPSRQVNTVLLAKKIALDSHVNSFYFARHQS